MFATTAGLQKAVGMLLLGLIAFLLGVGLSFREILGPLSRWFADSIRHGVARLVPADRVSWTEWFLGSIFLLMAPISFTAAPGRP